MYDKRKVITGSFNWPPAAAHTNNETLLVIHSPQLAKHFTREMDRLWDTAKLGITPNLQRKLDRQQIRCGYGVERGGGEEQREEWLEKWLGVYAAWALSIQATYFGNPSMRIWMH